MKNLVLICLLFSGASFAAIENVGSIIVNKRTSSAIYMECAMFEMGGDKCQTYKVIQVTQGDKELKSLNNTVYPAILTNDDYYINGKPINYEDYSYTQKRLNKMKENKNKASNGFKKAVLATVFYPVAAFLYAGETLVDFPQNAYKKSKKKILDSKFKDILKKLFHGEKNHLSKISNRKFKKLSKLLTEL